MKGIIDIGSNSVRLLFNGVKTVITTRLAENMHDGILDAVSMTRTIAAIEELCRKANNSCIAFATEALRKATNKNEFIAEVFRLTGLKIHVLSGEEEAEISYLGATQGCDSATVIDLGGASCEIINGSGGKISYKASFPFGCVTMRDKFEDDLNGIYKHVTKMLSALPSLKAERYIAVGGTATALAAVSQNLAVYDPSKVDGYKLEYAKIIEIIGLIGKGAHFPTIGERRKTINQGGIALCAVLDRMGQNAIYISESDNLEGYASKYLM